MSASSPIRWSTALSLQPVSAARSSEAVQLTAYEFDSQPGVRLRMYAVRGQAAEARPLRIRVLDQAGLERWLSAMRTAFAEPLAQELAACNVPADEKAFADIKAAILKEQLVFVVPRGIGLSAWSGDEKRQTHILRRFALLGQTLDGMRVWDVRRATQAIRSIHGEDRALRIEAEGQMAGVALYASLFEPHITGLDLTNLPASHQEGPALQNVLRILDLPAAVAMAAERHPVRLRGGEAGIWTYPQAVASKLRWLAERLIIEPSGE